MGIDKEKLFARSRLRLELLPPNSEIRLGSSDRSIIINSGIVVTITSFDMVTLGACAPQNPNEVGISKYQNVFGSWGASLDISGTGEINFKKKNLAIPVSTGPNKESSPLRSGMAFSQAMRDTLAALMFMPEDLARLAQNTGLAIGKAKKVNFKNFYAAESLALPGKTICALLNSGVIVRRLAGFPMQDETFYPASTQEIFWSSSQLDQFQPVAIILKQIHQNQPARDYNPANTDHPWRT